jgi:hypothetical protein
MRKKYRLSLRGTVLWCQYNDSGKQKSLGTKDRATAERLLHAKNEGARDSKALTGGFVTNPAPDGSAGGEIPLRILYDSNFERTETVTLTLISDSAY